MSEALFPALQDLLRQTGNESRKIDLIAVAVGPGSFTGLRIGVVVAKTMAYAIPAAVVGVNTLEAIAAQTAVALGDPRLVVKPVLNAQRKQLFASVYRSDDDLTVEQIEPDKIVERGPWMNSLKAGDVLTGSGLLPIVEELKSGVADAQDLVIAPRKTWNCSAEAVGRIGHSRFLAGRSDDLWRLEPYYFRPSAAEEALHSKLAERPGP